jgi:UDP-N-acetylmuramoyl-L-alanyl-D-glutamate--2,6-diaminopimelate ligase
MTTLLPAIDPVEVRGDASATTIRSVEFDSRRVGEGALFCCVPGARTDGHRHAAEAVGRGASALLCERILDLDVTQARVAEGELRPAMAAVSSAFYGHPWRDLRMAGVTGTNGKTTVTHLVQAVLDHAGLSTGVIGTLAGERTTPESPDLQRRLAEFRDGGRAAVAMEVSSHALTQHRVDAIVFDVVAFTNLSRDHLDHHGSMEEYFAAKARLFEPARARSAVVDVDDPWGRRLASGLEGPSGPTLVPVRRDEASEVVTAVGATTFTWRGRRVHLPLTGGFNVDNALVAAAMAVSLGLDEDQVVAGLATAGPIPGRMEVVAPGAGTPFSVVVDYAHTPAGLEAALTSARALAGAGRVVCVFGCGGDRDRGKRPEMGAVSSRLADVVVLTSDNPRSEDPLAIIGEIRAGLVGPPDGAAVRIEPDRARAIRLSVDLAEPGDLVLLAGKGHEATQTAGGRSRPFDDRTEARAALAARFGGAGA